MYLHLLHICIVNLSTSIHLSTILIFLISKSFGKRLTTPPPPPKKNHQIINVSFSKSRMWSVEILLYLRLHVCTFLTHLYFLYNTYIKSFPKHVFHDTWIQVPDSNWEKHRVRYRRGHHELKGERSKRGNSLFKKKKKIKKINTDNNKNYQAYCTVLFTRNKSITSSN